jgi:4-hydroxy-3-polyprenylbenzoate decarboxylase
MFPTLQHFLAALEADGDLLRVTEPVSPLLTITEIADRHAKHPAVRRSRVARHFDPCHCGLGGQALLFERVEGCDFPLAINVFGSYHRMERALGCGPDGFEAIARRIASLAKPQPPRSAGEAMAKAREVMPLLRVGPRRRRRNGRCQQVVRLTDRGEVNLDRFPMIKCWPLDGDPAAVGWPQSAEQAGTGRGRGRYITFAGMHTIHVDDEHDPRPASHNIGMYRAQLIDRTRLAMHWHMHHDGASHWRSWKRAGRPMPIAICFGGESVMPYAATAPLPPGLSELLMAGFLNGGGIPMVRAKTVPLWVPDHSEIVIEGWVSTDCGFIDFDPRGDEPLGPGAVLEGPFGDHTGFYSLPDRYPIVEVTAVTHCRRPVFPATVVGLPPQEDYYLGKATERIFLPLLQTLIPDIDDYHLPLFGCFHNCAFVQIAKAYPLQGRRVMHSVWGAGQMAWTKLVVVVDADVPVHDEPAVLEAIFRHAHFGRDLELVNGPLDILDHAAPRLGAGHKLGIDATRKVSGEEVGGVPVDDGEVPAPGVEDAEKRLKRHLEHPALAGWRVLPEGRGRCVLAAVHKTGPGQGGEIIEAVWAAAQRGRSAPPHLADFVIVVDEHVDLEDTDAVLFHACANGDPGRDLHRDGHRVGVDATTKLPGDDRLGQAVRPFPPILEMTDEVKQHVDDNAAAFGL